MHCFYKGVRVCTLPLFQKGWVGLMYIDLQPRVSERPVTAQTHVPNCDLHPPSETAFTRWTRATRLIRNRPEHLVGISCSEGRCFYVPIRPVFHQGLIVNTGLSNAPVAQQVSVGTYTEPHYGALSKPSSISQKRLGL